jgi:hypothetical protein
MWWDVVQPSGGVQPAKGFTTEETFAWLGLSTTEETFAWLGLSLLGFTPNKVLCTSSVHVFFLLKKNLYTFFSKKKPTTIVTRLLQKKKKEMLTVALTVGLTPARDGRTCRARVLRGEPVPAERLPPRLGSS